MSVRSGCGSAFPGSLLILFDSSIPDEMSQEYSREQTSTPTLGLTRFGGHFSVYREGVRNVEQGNEVSSGISQANGRIGLGRPQIRGPIQRVRPNGLDHPKMG